MRVKVKEKISIKEAMDNLANIAAIPMENPPPIAIVSQTRIITDATEIPEGEVRFLSGEGPEVLLSVVDLSYDAVNYHLQTLYDSPKMDFSSKKSKESIAAMMAICGQSAQRMNEYLAFRFNTQMLEPIQRRTSFRNLQRFYHERFSKKFEGGIEGSQSWDDTWQEKSNILKSSGTELKDFDAVLQDKEYELFFLKNEDGTPYLNHKLLQNLQVKAQFDIGIDSFEDDPFLKVKAILDRDIQNLSKQILQECSAQIHDLFHLSKKAFKNELGKNLCKAIIALFLSANPRHLLQSTTLKSCQHYFRDFQVFLRTILTSIDYEESLTYKGERSESMALFIHLANHLSFAFVTRHTSVKAEAIGLIYRSIRKGRDLHRNHMPAKVSSLWADLLLDDEQLRVLLHKYASGPLLKILDQVRLKEENPEGFGFDPWMQGSLPEEEFSFGKNKSKIAVISLASPTMQNKIAKAEINPEFKGFVNYLNSQSSKKIYLLVDLQDKNSWREASRSKSIENLSEKEGFSKCFKCVTLSKNSDFYHQDHQYVTCSNYQEFKENFLQILSHPQDHGLFFPKEFNEKKVLKIAETYFPIFHKYLFDSNENLTRQNREDFIELFYQILVLKISEALNVSYLSFTCKDSVDTGAFMNAQLFGLLKIIQGTVESKESIDFLRYLFYWRALSIRERVSNPEMFIRSISALETFFKAAEKHGSSLLGKLKLDYDL